MTQRPPRPPGRKPSLLVTVHYPHITIGKGLYAAIGAPPEVVLTWHAGVLLIGAPAHLPPTADWGRRTYTIKPVRSLELSAPVTSVVQDAAIASEGKIYRSPRISAQTALKQSGLADGSYLGQVEHGYIRIAYQPGSAVMPAPMATQPTHGTADTSQEWWTLREIQALCSLSHTALYRAIKAGTLEIDPVLSTRLSKTIVSHAALVAYLRHRQATVGEQYPDFLGDERLSDD
jgi:hypothetical protein